VITHDRYCRITTLQHVGQPDLTSPDHQHVSSRLLVRGIGGYTYGDGDVISMPAGFRRHLVGKTPINVFHCDIAEMRFIDKIVISQTFS